MSDTFILIFFLGLISSLFILLAFEIRRIIYIIKNQVVLTGKIVKKIEITTDDGKFHKPIIEYLDPETNELKTFQSGFPIYKFTKLGKLVELSYYVKKGKTSIEIKKYTFFRLVSITVISILIMLFFLGWQLH